MRESIHFGLLLFCWFQCSCSEENPFDDSVLFKFSWPGPFQKEFLEGEDVATLNVTTVNNEKYQCTLPKVGKKEKSKYSDYNGPTGFDLLYPLFKQSSCSYRLESYWTYEICHGRYVRQYHEEREGKKVKLQEFYLGRWDGGQADKYSEEIEALEKSSNSYIPTKKIENLQMPYVQMNMTGGTMCDLNGKHRMCRILYICYLHGKHEVYSLKETSTCEYEMIVLSPLLCSHPRYRPVDSGEYTINCYGKDGAPKKPRSLLMMEAENLKTKHQKLSEETLKRVYAVFQIAEGQDGRSEVRYEVHPVDPNEAQDETQPTYTRPTKSLFPASDTNPEENFLSGKGCITGGSTWWKFELCYMKQVTQFHVEKDSTKTSIVLGRFDKQAHIDWLKKNPHKKPKPVADRKQVHHFYANGDVCEVTGIPRQVEVKMKCVQEISRTAVTLFLMEPKTCEYILGVESSLICDILPKVDEYGLYDAGDDEGVSVTDDDDDPMLLLKPSHN